VLRLTFLLRRLTKIIGWTLGDGDVAAAIGAALGKLVKTLHHARPVASPMYVSSRWVVLNFTTD
jgi:hypothetical protein